MTIDGSRTILLFLNLIFILSYPLASFSSPSSDFRALENGTDCMKSITTSRKIDNEFYPLLITDNKLHDQILAELDPSQTKVSTALTKELQDLATPEAELEACMASGVCAPETQGVPKPYSFLRRIVLRSASEFWESIKAIRGSHLRANKVALHDFFKNMAIIWPGQIFGALQNGAPLTFQALAQAPHLLMYQIPMTVLYHTLFMVWTQSDRGAKGTPHLILPKPNNAKEFLVGFLKAYTGGKNLDQNGYAEFKRETADRFVGFASLIPLEIAHLSILTSLQVLMSEDFQRLFYANTTLNSSELPAALADKAIFATAFGFYLALKWSLIQKPLDLRALPMAREWMSRAYIEARVRGIKPTAQARFNHYISLPLEMTYRYGNSFIDGIAVMWFFTTGSPMLRQALENLF